MFHTLPALCEHADASVTDALPLTSTAPPLNVHALAPDTVHDDPLGTDTAPPDTATPPLNVVLDKSATTPDPLTDTLAASGDACDIVHDPDDTARLTPPSRPLSAALTVTLAPDTCTRPALPDNALLDVRLYWPLWNTSALLPPDSATPPLPPLLGLHTPTPDSTTVTPAPIFTDPPLVIELLPDSDVFACTNTLPPLPLTDNAPDRLVAAATTNTPLPDTCSATAADDTDSASWPADTDTLAPDASCCSDAAHHTFAPVTSSRPPADPDTLDDASSVKLPPASCRSPLAPSTTAPLDTTDPPLDSTSAPLHTLTAPPDETLTGTPIALVVDDAFFTSTPAPLTLRLPPTPLPLVSELLDASHSAPLTCDHAAPPPRLMSPPLHTTALDVVNATLPQSTPSR
jgi:hypothetical protein